MFRLQESYSRLRFLRFEYIRPYLPDREEVVVALGGIGSLCEGQLTQSERVRILGSLNSTAEETIVYSC